MLDPRRIRAGSIGNTLNAANVVSAPPARAAFVRMFGGTLVLVRVRLRVSSAAALIADCRAFADVDRGGRSVPTDGGTSRLFRIE